MKKDRLEGAADDIKMPEYLKKRILTKCSEISESQPSDKQFHIQASGVERVSDNPIKRTFTAVAACAVLVSGFGIAAHFMPRPSANDRTAELSNDDKEQITAAFADFFDNESITESGTELTTEQRNKIKEIISAYSWTEIDEKQFAAESENAPCEGQFSLIAANSERICTLVIMDNDHAIFTCKPLEVTEDLQVTTAYYSVDTTEMYEKIASVLNHEEETVAPVPLSDIAEKEYKEVSYSSTEPISQEKRNELSALLNEDTFTYTPDINSIYSNPWYIFTAQDGDLEKVTDYIYLYKNGTAELHENGKTYFYSYDFGTVSKSIDEILFSDRMVKGSDLVCANMVAENVTYHGDKNFEALSLSEDTKTVVYNYLSGITFRKCTEDDLQKYRFTPDIASFNRTLGYESFELNNYDQMNGWALHFNDSGTLEVADVTDGYPEFTYYMFDPVEVYSAITDAIPELASGYPPFGMIYKMGDITINGNAVPEYNRKSLSNVFFGFNWQGDTVSDEFRSETPLFNIEVGDELNIRIYEDGTLEYKESDEKVHTYLKLGYPETMACNYFTIMDFFTEPTDFSN